MESGKVVAGKYRLNQLLGSGGMAEVWSATNTFTERQIAIKFMNTQVAKTPEAAARFLKEAKVSARVNHPNIIDILDVGQTEDGQLFLVMELLTGYPLEVALRRQTPPMTIYEFSLVMLEVAGALAAAHRAGVVHRDLKPTNIFLFKSRDGAAIPKVLDFGVSKFLEEDQNHALTVAGTVLGSPLYMSPEQARGDSHLDGRTDIFAFGAILFEALTGYRAYEAKNFNALIVKIATSKPKSIDASAPHVPESLRAIVRACLEVDLKHRVSTFDEVIAMIHAALPELELSPLRLPTPTIAATGGDPDATNALPVMRASDRPPAAHDVGHGSIPPPPPNGYHSGSIPPGAIPAYPSPGPTGPSWHTPNTSYASITMRAPARRSFAWVFAAVGAVGVFGIAVGIALAWRSRPAGAEVVALAGTAQHSQTTATPPATSASAEMQAVSVDSLPGTNGRALGPVPRGAGRLFVTATPGWCSISVDGKERGATPIAPLDLSIGPHRLECRTPNGKAKAASITVQDGATSRYKFSLDD